MDGPVKPGHDGGERSRDPAAEPPQGRPAARAHARNRPSGARKDRRKLSYILNTPNVVFSTGAFRQADSARPTTLRVSAGAMMPSSHIRAVEK
jgi:hypothetical protein